MTQIIRLAKATGAQLQQAARHAQLIDVPNMPYGFGNAYYSAMPSPMQEVILRKGLQSAGINYLKVEECVTAASEADRFPKELRTALNAMIKEARPAFGEVRRKVIPNGYLLVESEIRVVGQVLYAVVTGNNSELPSVPIAQVVVKGKGFTRTGSRTWNKVVKMKRKSFVAVVEATDTGLMLSVFKGA